MKIKLYITLYILAFIAFIGVFSMYDAQPKSATKPTFTPTPTITKPVDMGTGDYLLLNQYRVAQGKRPLIRNAELEAVAINRAYRLALGLDNWSHEAFREGAKERLKQNIGAGENLARGYINFEDVVIAWGKSPSHDKNMLGEWCEAGIARYGSYWVALFQKDYSNNCYK